MKFLRNLPLRQKLLFGLLTTCLAGVGFACAVLFWFQSITFRNGFVAELESLGAIIAHNSAAPLAFADAKSAAEVLDALKVKPQIISARIFDSAGNLFSQMNRAGGTAASPPAPAGTGIIFDHGYAHLVLPIKLDDSKLGQLEVSAHYDDEYGRLLSLYGTVMLAVIAGSLVLILLMSAALQRFITRPIVTLADVARGVSEREDYTARAPETGKDEVGLLTRTFNRMLDQIQSRDLRLRESQQRYEVAVMGSSDGLWDYDFSTNTIFYSPRWKDMAGYADHELANQPQVFADLLHPEDRAGVREKIAAYLGGTGAAYIAEFRLRHKDGDYRWILSRGAALRDAGGKPLRFAGSHSDITARRLAVERERLQAERLAQHQAILLALSQSSMQEWEHQVTTLLPEMARFLGVERVSFWRTKDRQQILDREKQFVLSRDAFEPEGVQLRASELPAHFATFTQTGAPLAFHDALHDPTLAVYAAARLAPLGIASVLHAPVCQNGQLAGVIVCEHVGAPRVWTAEEIDFARAVAQQSALGLESQERRRAEEFLRQSEVRYRSVVESVKEVVFQTDATGAWVFLNSAWRDITGNFLEDSLGRSCLDFVHHEDRAKCDALMRPVFEKAQSGCHGEIRFLTREGEVRWIELMAQVTLDRDQVLGGLSGTLTDITARKATESEMARLHRELVDTSRQAGMAEVATGVLHNVGNVLNSVNVSANLIVEQVRKSKTASLAKAAQLLREHKGDLGQFLSHDPKGKQLPPFIEAISEQLVREQGALAMEVQALQTNIEHIKQIVAMQQSYAKVSGAREILPVHELVEDALRMNSSSLTRHQIDLVREFADVPAVLVDRHKVLQILVNLISNGQQAMEPRPEGRRLVLRIALSGGDRVRVEVADNGMGIPPENLVRIFNHGFTTKQTGHGFGLHSCANAAKELGGSLTVQSAGSGLGATFTLALPITEKRALSPAA